MGGVRAMVLVDLGKHNSILQNCTATRRLTITPAPTPAPAATAAAAATTTTTMFITINTYY